MTQGTKSFYLLNDHHMIRINPLLLTKPTLHTKKLMHKIVRLFIKVTCKWQSQQSDPDSLALEPWTSPFWEPSEKVIRKMKRSSPGTPGAGDRTL